MIAGRMPRTACRNFTFTPVLLIQSTFDELQSICRHPRQILVMVKIYIKSVVVGTSAPSSLVTISHCGNAARFE
jgi:hypothetical protein